MSIFDPYTREELVKMLYAEEKSCIRLSESLHYCGKKRNEYECQRDKARAERDEARKLAEELRECAVEHESVYKTIPFPWEEK
jgi:uncharacterized coiled-coil DUF342 family protein